MSSVKTKRYYTGVTLEPNVVNYLDELTERVGMNRSWVLNAIVQEYARFVEAKNITPLKSREELFRL